MLLLINDPLHRRVGGGSSPVRAGTASSTPRGDPVF